MMQPSSLLVVDPDSRGLETLTFGFEREGYTVAGTSDLRRAELIRKLVVQNSNGEQFGTSTAGAEMAR